MAEEGTSMEIGAHEQTYGGFLALLKYGGIASFVVGAIVVLIIAS